MASSKSNIDLAYFSKKFSTDKKCRRYLESALWGDTPICPHCNGTHAYTLNGKSHRKGLYKCSVCRKPFTVTVGTVFERSHVSLPQWFTAIYLIVHSSKSVSSVEMGEFLGVTQKTAWFMNHRIRYALSIDGETKTLFDDIVEVDETYIGGKSKKGIRGRGSENKTPVVALIERESNEVRTQVIQHVNAEELGDAIKDNVEPSTCLMTDEWKSYKPIGKGYADHQTVNHSIEEYANGDTHVNSCESYFSILKRAIYGTFHFISKKHLHRYCDEFDFRWNNRTQSMNRIKQVLKKMSGKRLVYKATIDSKGFLLGLT